jgi:Primase X
MMRLPVAAPRLSDLELRYPFAPRSRQFFESISVEERLASKEVVRQAEARLLSSIGRGRYEPSMTELVEFSSFFAAALVASQDPVLASRFSKKEAERSKGFFVHEDPSSKITAMNECFGAPLKSDENGGRATYSFPFESYLAIVSKYELTRNPVWKLARQELGKGMITMTDNKLNDFFGDCAVAAISDGVRNLRRAPFPRQLLGLRGDVVQYVPSPRPRTNKGYLYVEDLLAHPVSDGRHRLTWLVLAPYLVNVRKLDDEEAIEKIRAFTQAAGDSGAMRRFIEYNVRRARRNGLLPPTLSTLKAEHPDIYGLLPKEVLAKEVPAKKPSK